MRFILNSYNFSLIIVSSLSFIYIEGVDHSSIPSIAERYAYFIMEDHSVLGPNLKKGWKAIAMVLSHAGNSRWECAILNKNI